MKAGDAPLADTTAGRRRRRTLRTGRGTVCWFVALALAVFAASSLIERRMRAEMRAQAVRELAAMADLKVDQISAWRAERLADAAAIAAPPLERDGLARLARGDPPDAVADWYRAIQGRHLYADVLVLSARGEALFSTAGARGAPVDAPTADAAARALAGGHAVLSELHRSPRDGRAYIEAAAPIPGAAGAAALVLRTDAETLFPLLQAWPSSGPTVETVLVRRDGDEVLFLNELRHERGAALAKRLPLSQADRVSAQAVTGATGAHEGLDYRGVHVLAEIRAVPDSAWRLVAKVDRDEILSSERHLAWAAWTSMGVFLALGALLAWAWWRAERQALEAAERASLDEALRHRAEILANVHDAVISMDARGCITWWNRAAERVYGWTEAEVVGRYLPELLRTELGPGRTVEWMIGEVQRLGRLELTVRHRRRDGSTVEVEASVVARRGSDGALLGYISVNRDVTERRRAEAELKRAGERLSVASRMASVGTLAAGVAHEVNNPLAFVIANLATADEAAASLRSAPPDLRDALRDARDGAERVRRIVSELRTFSRPEEAASVAVDVRSVLDAAVNLARHEIRHRARVVKAYEDVPPVEANEARLAQAFLNLVVNAAQAIPEGHADAHEIRLAVRPDGGRVRAEVSDTGVGIAPEHLGRVFDPFFTTKPVGAGTGLGLSICHGIVSSLGGEIRVESAPGRGATFAVILPAATPPAAGTLSPRSADSPADAARTAAGPPTAPPQDGAAAPAPAAGARRGRVLVVDDEPPLAASLQRVLGREHDVVTVSSGRAALDLVLRGDRFDVILCDLMMPEITGMDLADRLAREAPDAARAMVFMTGGAFTPRAREFLGDPERRHIDKPFDPQTLRALVRELVGP